MPWAIAAARSWRSARSRRTRYTPLVAAPHASGSRRTSPERGPDPADRAAWARAPTCSHVDLAAAEARLERDPWIADATVDASSRTRWRSGGGAGAGGRHGRRRRRARVVADGRHRGRRRGGARSPPAGDRRDGRELPARRRRLRSGAAVAATRCPAPLRAPDGLDLGRRRRVHGRADLARAISVTYGDGSQLEAKGQSLKASSPGREREAWPLARWTYGAGRAHGAAVTAAPMRPPARRCHRGSATVIAQPSIRSRR